MIDRGTCRHCSRRYRCGAVKESHWKNINWYWFAFVEEEENRFDVVDLEFSDHYLR